MRIVIDLQGAQTESRFRGIGRYSMSLAKAIVRNRGKHEIIIALSGLFPDTIMPIRREFEGLLPHENIRVWYAVGPVKESHNGNQIRRKVAEKMREAFLSSLAPDMLLVSSIFEGFIDDAVTSINEFIKIPTFVILYDLIPLLNPDMYLKPNNLYCDYYMRKLEYLKKADGLFSISSYSAEEGSRGLQISPERITNISTACDDIFQVNHELQCDLAKYGINKNFILYTGGADARKNLPSLIKAFALLPLAVQKEHQLVFAGKMPEGEVNSLSNIAHQCNIPKESFILTGYVSEEVLVALYNKCTLFVFPSLSEGFGLPVLEAINCGAPVIASNTSSIPEVVGYIDALFDPLDVHDINIKMLRALTDIDFIQNLKTYEALQMPKFSWNTSAHNVLSFFESMNNTNPLNNTTSQIKMQLAYVSPLPPEKTGIADYSAELIPELFVDYDITIITDQSYVSNQWIQSHCKIHNSKWLIKNYHIFDRVLYHFGNSPYHSYMIELIDKIPGIVVLHDFYTPNLFYYNNNHVSDIYFLQKLYDSHQYTALQELATKNTIEIKDKYPTNLYIIMRAKSVIVHSNYSKQLAQTWYGKETADIFYTIPLLRKLGIQKNKIFARRNLMLPESAVIVCSFGILAQTKLNHRLLSAWKQSTCSKNNNFYLIFVGTYPDNDYMRDLSNIVDTIDLKSNILFTGWISEEIYNDYLASADIAVQLRTNSRGETSAAIYDCMKFKLPTIVNANGSISEIPQNTVFMLPENFSDSDLISALEILAYDKTFRFRLGQEAYNEVLINHAPEKCVRMFKQVIEKTYKHNNYVLTTLIKDIANIVKYEDDCYALENISNALAQNIQLIKCHKQLLLDITATCQTTRVTGIERVAKSIVLSLISSPPNGYRIEPVYLSNDRGQWNFKYARKYTLSLIHLSQNILQDEIVEFHCDDIILSLDFANELVAASEFGLYKHLKDIGVRLYSMVYDILPIKLPHYFPPNTDVVFSQWLNAVVKDMDGCVCDSCSVANELKNLVQIRIPNRFSQFRIAWNHLGSDINSSAPTLGMPPNACETLSILTSSTTFLIVGTIEPRKGHLQLIEGFTRLWDYNLKCNLVIIGGEGWKDVPEEDRRTIPKIVSTINKNSQLNKRLFWLQDISDEYLEKIYDLSSCLIFASEDEGFGLPLIEAARHKLPIIARDIPVFREVAGDHAFYFSGETGHDLAEAIKQWLALYREGKHPKSDDMPWLTWRESAQQLLRAIGIEEDSGDENHD